MVQEVVVVDDLIYRCRSAVYRQGRSQRTLDSERQAFQRLVFPT